MVLRSKFAAIPLIAFYIFATDADVAGAGDHRPLGVVELFTSQGCSSCPPADAVLADLAAEGEVLALSYHVDYWNYLGWKDTLASPENTARQKAYARTLERKSVYTPQAILNGRDHVNGSERGEIESTIAAMDRNGEGMLVDLSLRRDEESITIDIARGSGKAHVVLVVFDRRNVVPVDSGENGGRSFTYVNSVRSLQIVGLWKGVPQTIELPATIVDDWQRRNCAVFLQKMKEEDAPGPIVGAALMEP